MSYLKELEPEVKHSITGAKIKLLVRPPLLLEGLGENPLLDSLK